MKTFIAEVIPQIKKFSQRINQRAVLINNKWIFINPDDSVKYTYIFRGTGELLLSSGGNVIKGKWEQLNDGLLMIEDGINQSSLFRYDFFDGIVLALNKDDTKEYALFINESKSNMPFNSVKDITDFLADRYLNKPEKGLIGRGRKKQETIEIIPRQETERTRILREKQQELLLWLILGAIVLAAIVSFLSK